MAYTLTVIENLCVDQVDESRSEFESYQNVHLNSDRKVSQSSEDSLLLESSEDSFSDQEESGPLVGDVREHERLVVGWRVDPRIVPGFAYQVRPVNQQKPLFKGRALRLVSIGMGYGRRITFESEQRNANDNYFWSDNYPLGYAFSIHVVDAGLKFTIYDANRLALGTCEIVEVEEAQTELVDQERTDAGGRVTKHVQVEMLCLVEWYDDYETDVRQPCRVAGVVVATTAAGGRAAQVDRLVHVSVGHHRRLTLLPGVDDKMRRVRVDGAQAGDVPARYTVSGLEAYEMPVIGTYVDRRIVTGFCYKIRPAHGTRALFQGRALRLVSVGAGYGKRITMESDGGRRLTNDNYFWSDSYSDGLGFSLHVVRPGDAFVVVDARQRRHIGDARVFQVVGPQVEEDHQVLVDGSVRKRVRVDLTCHVTFDADIALGEVGLTRTLRVSGICVVERAAGRDAQARLSRIEHIGVDSQLCVMLLDRFDSLTFLPGGP